MGCSNQLVSITMSPKHFSGFNVLQLFKNTTQRSVLRQDSYEWHGVWVSMHRHLGQWAPAVFWNFTPEHVKNPEKLVNCLKKVCCHTGSSGETQINAACWGLAHACQALFSTIQHPQGEEKEDLRAQTVNRAYCFLFSVVIQWDIFSMSPPSLVIFWNLCPLASPGSLPRFLCDQGFL